MPKNVIWKHEEEMKRKRKKILKLRFRIFLLLFINEMVVVSIRHKLTFINFDEEKIYIMTRFNTL